MDQSIFDAISGGKLLLIVIILFATILLYTRVIQPYRLYRLYKHLLTANYQTLVFPFSILGTLYFHLGKQDLAKYGDSQHTAKYEFRKYQVILNTFKGRVFIDFIDPELIRQFYEKHLEGCYVKAMNVPAFSGLKTFLGNGLVFSEGQEWKTKRKIMSTVFNYDFIKSKVSTIASICSSVLDSEQQSPANKGKSEVKVDVNLLLQKIFGNVVIRCFFGDIALKDIDGQSPFSYVNNILELSAQRSTSWFPFILGPSFHKYNLRSIDREVKRKIKRFRDYAKQTVENHIAKMQAESQGSKQRGYDGVIDLLIKENRLKDDSYHSEEEQKDYYTHSDLIDEFTTFFMAGTDTTSNNTTILIYLLAKYPEVQAKVRKQLSEVLGNDCSNLTFENLKKLSYLEQVQKETLRMYGPSSGVFMREALKDHYIKDIPILKGMMVSVKIKANHFKQSFYQHPEVFNPDRWQELENAKMNPYSYFPFSSGPRNCIGQHLALLESKIAVALILDRFSSISLEKPEFRLYMRTLYSAQSMTTTFTKRL